MIPERYIMYVLCAICCCINYADRVNMSVAIIAIGEHYKYTVEEQGIIMSSFFIGYLPMQVGGAILCRRFGGKAVLSHGAFLWSMFTVLTPFACELGYYPLLLCRVFMGLSEGVAFPGIYHFLSSWIPKSERGRSISIFLTGVHVGTTSALVLSPIIIRLHSWQLIFYAFGTAGLLWIVAWNLLAYDRDGLKPAHVDGTHSGGQETDSAGDVQEDQVPFLSNASIVSLRRSLSQDSIDTDVEPGRSTQTILSSTSGKIQTPPKSPVAFMYRFLDPGESKSIAIILSDKRCLAVCAAQALYGFVHYTILSWLPSYFRHVYNAETENLSFTFLPYFAMAVSANVGGYAADKLLERLQSRTKVLKIVTIVANGGAALMLIAFSFAPTAGTALAYISISMAFMSFNSGGFESAFFDNAEPSLSGMFKAVANTMASFSGFVAVPFATFVLRWSGDSWRFVFGSLSAWFIMLAVVYCSYGSGEEILREDVK